LHIILTFTVKEQGTFTMTAQLYLEGNGVRITKMHHSTTWTTCMCHYNTVIHG